MAPIKFEEQIKYKLEQRTVEPSTQAWSNLSQRLDADDNRSKKSSYWWFGIAASIAALVFISVTYFGQKDETTIDQIIVKDNLEELTLPKTEEKFTKKDEFDKNDNIVAIDKNEAVKDIPVNTNNISTQKKQKKALSIKVQNAPIVNLAKVENQKEQEVSDSKTSKATNDFKTPVKDVELKSVVAELQKIKTENKSTVTDQQIDSLLKVANRELLMDKALNKTSDIVVDADALLRYAEEDLGQSFRTRIYELLKNSFNEAKTAVANRNN